MMKGEDAIDDGGPMRDDVEPTSGDDAGPAAGSRDGLPPMWRRLDAVCLYDSRERPVLGVCLGHQCIGHVFGGEVVRNARVMHGKTSPIHHDGQGVFRGLSNPFEATRYHSLVIRRETFHNPDFEISAWTAEGEIMAVRHRRHATEGVQFHPESILTPDGPRLLANFLNGVSHVAAA